MKKVLKIVFFGFIFLFVLTATITLVKTMTVSSKQMNVTPVTPVPIDKAMAAKHLSQIIKFKTISYLESEKFNHDEFFAMQDYLLEAYPQAHSLLEREIVAKLSLLYTWRGTDASLKPILLMAHQDVIPVEPGTEDDWTYPALCS